MAASQKQKVPAHVNTAPKAVGHDDVDAVNVSLLHVWPTALGDGAAAGAATMTAVLRSVSDLVGGEGPRPRVDAPPWSGCKL